MDDDARELLGLAARAARLDMRWIVACGDYYEHRPHMPPGYWDKWDPLQDDGDALRLAACLEMDVMQRRSDPEVWVQAPMQATIREPIGSDRAAATRRAIVRAAAAMAKPGVLGAA